MVLGLRRTSAAVDDEMRGMRAVAPDAELAARAPDFLAQEVGGSLHHDSGPVPARRARPDRVRHRAQRRLHVGRIDAGRTDFDDHLIGLDLGLERLQDSDRASIVSAFW